MYQDKDTKLNEGDLIKLIAIGIGTIILLIILIISGIMGVSACWAKYNVWSSGQQGHAELQRADWNRQILVREANAKRDAAISLAAAEVERAKGVAAANKIIGDSLKDNEAYLRYLWIENLQNDKNQVIYVPTETNLPILEAHRLDKKV